MNNLTVRTISGIVFGLITIGCLLFNQYLFAAYVIFIMVVMLSEFFRMSLGPDLYKNSRHMAVAAAIILFGLLFANKAFGLSMKYVALSMIPVMLVMINSLLVKDKSEFGKFSSIYTGLLYIAAPLSLSNIIAFRDGQFSGILLLSFFCIIAASDIGAYVFGMALGQKYGKKLCPRISPKKSWIGFWGGVGFAILVAVVLNLVGMLKIPFVHSVILAIIMDVAGVFGDLFESQWKRYYDIKDSGNIIPGHGGLLDRFDSTLFAIPFGAIYLSLFNLL